ncbi:ATP-binding protein, partial [Streptomyces sp. NRRL F-6602]
MNSFGSSTPRAGAPVGAVRRRAVVDALRRGAVPESGLDLLATGLSRFEQAVDEELGTVAAGGSVFKAVRGEYGSGKTFFTRWLGERAKRRTFAVAEVQVSETETPLHKLETVYRRLTERLTTASFPPSALLPVADAWFYALEEDALADGAAESELPQAVERLLTARLAEVSRQAPAFATALRGYKQSLDAGDEATAAAVMAWLGGQPHVAAAARRSAGAIRPRGAAAPNHT